MPQLKDDGSRNDAAAGRGVVYIASVTDDRKFENKRSDPSVPSIDGDVNRRKSGAS